MKYLTVSVWALSAAMGSWLAYDYHVDVVEGWKSKAEYQRKNADYWFWRADEQSDKYWAEYEQHKKTIEALGAAERDAEAWKFESAILQDALDFHVSLVAELSPEPIVNPDPMDATMKLYVEGGGHGSGTHIGGGYVITAGHVAENEGDKLTAKFSDGAQRDAVTMWSSATYDVALLKIDGWEGPASNLDCRIPEVGEDVGLYGNPLAMEFVHTYGKVASGITRAYSTAWAEALPIDGAMGPGMSGGGAFDEDGDLVGINVGVPLTKIGMASVPVGISFIVPASTICGLLAR